MTLDRRSFIKLVGSASGLALAGCATQGAPGVAAGSAGEIMPKGGARRVVVVGGGLAARLPPSMCACTTSRSKS